MKIDIDFNEALEAYCQEMNNHRMLSGLSNAEKEIIAEQCSKLLEILNWYGDIVDAIRLILSQNETLKTLVVTRLMDDIYENL